jgi:hypothetical protein
MAVIPVKYCLEIPEGFAVANDNVGGRFSARPEFRSPL